MIWVDSVIPLQVIWMTKRQHMQPRLPARPSRWGDLLVYHGLVRPALRSMFDQIRLDTSRLSPTELAILGADTPVLCYVTHAAWWDGYLAFELFRTVYPRQHFLMMEEAQLRRYFFFRWAGCFSVDRADPREALRALRYAAQLLKATRRSLVWIFPQGSIRPVDQRPLALYRGAAEIATRTDGVWCLPLALRYEFGPEQRPEALLTLGQPHWASANTSRSQLQQYMETALTATADALRDDWNAGQLDHFRTILRGRPSVNRRFDAILGPLVRRWFSPRSAN